ncbi:MAG: hypothetical protein HY340_02235 [Candidatus Kerfeldbacteria bacterium]|nr:hypothetical protein [Candidatus Kerfeldbacteria bacterium]
MSKPLTEDAFNTRLTGAVREIISHFNQSQGGQTQQFNERFDQVDAKLAAIMEMLAMRQELRNLLRELKASGIAIDESKVLVS